MTQENSVVLTEETTSVTPNEQTEKRQKRGEVNSHIHIDEAAFLAEGAPVQEIANKGYYDSCKTIDQEADLEVIISIEKREGARVEEPGNNADFDSFEMVSQGCEIHRPHGSSFPAESKMITWLEFISRLESRRDELPESDHDAFTLQVNPLIRRILAEPEFAKLDSITMGQIDYADTLNEMALPASFAQVILQIGVDPYVDSKGSDEVSEAIGQSAIEDEEPPFDSNAPEAPATEYDLTLDNVIDACKSQMEAGEISIITNTDSVENLSDHIAFTIGRFARTGLPELILIGTYPNLTLEIFNYIIGYDIVVDSQTVSIGSIKNSLTKQEMVLANLTDRDLSWLVDGLGKPSPNFITNVISTNGFAEIAKSIYGTDDTPFVILTGPVFTPVPGARNNAEEVQILVNFLHTVSTYDFDPKDAELGFEGDPDDVAFPTETSVA